MWRASALLLGAVGAILAASPASAAPREFYGVVPQAELNAQDLERMGAGRVGTVRVTLPWAEVDPSPLPRDYRWEDFDAIVAGAAREGIRVLPTLYTVPRWVADLEDCDRESESCSITPPRSELGLDAWRDFVGAAVERYGPGGSLWALNQGLRAEPIRAWQVWNEPNSPGFYQPKPDVEDYADLLTDAAGAIRAHDPSAEVVLGGLFRYPLNGRKGGIRATDFLARLYEQPGAEQAFDGVAIHPYAARMRGVRPSVRRLIEVVERAGDEHAGIWITEIGWASGGRRNPLNRGRKGQARRLEQAFRWFTKKRRPLGIRLVAWYAWRDADPTAVRCKWCARSGLFSEHGVAPKPAWESFTGFTGGR